MNRGEYNREDMKIEVYVDAHNGYHLHRVVCTMDECSTLTATEKREYIASALIYAGKQLEKELEDECFEKNEYHFTKEWKIK